MTARQITGGALLAVLASVAVVPAPGASAQTSRTLVLSPATGPAGTDVKATAAGFGHCLPGYDDASPSESSTVPDTGGTGLVLFGWVDGDQTWTAPVQPDGTATATVTVPGGFTPGAHELVAWCNAVGTPDPARALFTVPEEPRPSPRLTVDPVNGTVGSTTRAVATGFDCEEVTFLWHGTDEAARSSPDSGGTAVAAVTVPTNFPPQRHDLVAQCQDDTSQMALAWFTVVPVGPGPALMIDPTSGKLGTTVDAVATGFDCGEVVFLARGGEVGRSVVENGTASIATTVPDDISPGRYELVAQCAPGGGQRAATWFMVESVGASSWLDWWWLGVVALGLLMVTSLQAVRGLRGRRWVRSHVRVAPGPASASGPITMESPVGTSPPDVVVRIEPHADPGTQVLEEVDQ